MTIPRIAPYPMPTGIDFPTNRVDWQINPQRAALLIHDMQGYFLNFFDVQQSPIAELLENITVLKNCCRSQGIPVFYTAQPAEQSPTDRGLLNDFWGPGLSAQPHQEAITAALKPDDHDRVLVKWRYSAFQRTPLQSLLKTEGRDQLILCGVYAHIGCLMTACDAFMSDIQPFLVGDAVADFSLEHHQMALTYIAQRCGMTLPNQQVMAMLTQDSSVVSITDVLRQQLAELLQQPSQKVGVEENLLDWGLDSIRLMSLVEIWRHQGAQVSFADLAEQPTIAAWTQLLTRDGLQPAFDHRTTDHRTTDHHTHHHTHHPLTSERVHQRSLPERSTSL
jgi:bifunctional isochorismate lyase/aryl carrier protein